MRFTPLVIVSTEDQKKKGDDAFSELMVLSELQRLMMGSGGCDADEIPEGYGEFGLQKLPKSGYFPSSWFR